MKALIVALCLLLPGALRAQVWLPDRALAMQAIDAQPEVQAALQRRDAAVAEARRRAAGPYEFEVSVTAQQRRVAELAGDNRFPEYEAQVGRTFRWPNKARLDHEIGERGVEAADLHLDDARHQAALQLLVRWADWLRSTELAKMTSAQADSLKRERAAVARRVQLGDAARRDLDLLDVEVARADAARIVADGKRAIDHTALTNDFPGLPIPARAPAVGDPAPVIGSDASWVARIVSQSHEIAARVADAAQADAMSARTRADRVPDPTVGLRGLSEFGGRERALGVVFQMPLPGRARAAAVTAQAAAAAALHDDAAATRRDVQREAEVAVRQMRLSVTQWQAQERALIAAREASRRTYRGWELGELGIADWLLAERSLREVELDETSMRINADAALRRVLIDSHELWESP